MSILDSILRSAWEHSGSIAEEAVGNLCLVEEAVGILLLAEEAVGILLLAEEAGDNLLLEILGEAGDTPTVSVVHMKPYT